MRTYDLGENLKCGLYDGILCVMVDPINRTEDLMKIADAVSCRLAVRVGIILQTFTLSSDFPDDDIGPHGFGRYGSHLLYYLVSS